MSLSRTNPLSTKILGRLGSEGLAEQIRKLHKRVSSASTARDSWLEKQERLLRQRRGVRKKRIFPWPGANNHNWPLSDAIIRRWKPGISALVFNADPVTFFFPTKPDAVPSSPTAQAYYHWSFHQIPDVVKKTVRLSDYIAQHGMAYTRQGWDYRTRKSCRIVRTESLFPGGPEVAHQQFVAAIQQQRQQIEMAVQQGQIDPSALEQIPPEPTLDEFVTQTLQDEYQINVDGENALESQQVQAAMNAILQGADYVKFYYQVVEADRLAWTVWNPTKVIVPPDTTCIEESDFIVFIHNPSADDVLRKAADGHFDMQPAQLTAKRFRQNKSAVQHSEQEQRNLDAFFDVQSRSEGVDRHEPDENEKGELWEVLCKLDIDGDGINEKVVLWLDPQTFDQTNDVTQAEDGVLALYPYPFPFEEWNITPFNFEEVSDRPYSSRGVAEMVSVFQGLVTRLHNFRLDALQIVLSPMFTMRSSSPTDTVRRNIRFMPGIVIPLSPEGEFKPVQTQATDIFQSLTEENFTKTLAEQYVGIFDPSVLQQGAAERRTATEVEAILGQVNSIANSDAALFQAAMAKVHRQLWKLLMEFGPEETYFRVTGEEQPRFARRSEIDLEYDIIPAGTPFNTSKQIASARSREALTFLAADNTGLINKHELFAWYLSTLDSTMAKRILRSPAEATAIAQITEAANLAQEEQGFEGNIPTP